MAEMVKVADADELPPGERIHVEFEESTLIILNVDGEFYGIADLCTHDGGPLADADLHGFNIECPRHGACFDIRSGKVTRLPATDPIPTYRVEVRDGEIWVENPDIW